MSKQLGCDYQGYEFGANYPDSVCIDGYLWDADSGGATEDGWEYTFGGEIPCPNCNALEWRAQYKEEVTDQGISDYLEGVPLSAASRIRVGLRAAWKRGWHDAKTKLAEEAALEGTGSSPAGRDVPGQHDAPGQEP